MGSDGSGKGGCIPPAAQPHPSLLSAQATDFAISAAVAGAANDECPVLEAGALPPCATSQPLL